MDSNWIHLHPSDSVGIVITAFKKGETVIYKSSSIEFRDNIPTGHKFAVTNLSKGENILKYGSPIGKATRVIRRGEWIHSHNMITNLRDLLEYKYSPSYTTPSAKNNSSKSFLGYIRINGEAGIRNEIWIIPVTACVNGTVKILEKESKNIPGIEGIDGIYSFTHPYGCSQTGQDLERSREMLVSLAQHPNAGGVLIVGLGCENITMDSIQKSIGIYDPDRIKFMITQNNHNEIADGCLLLKDLVEVCKKDNRSELPLSMLRIGLKCGGSDGFSGITANPVVGTVSDFFIKEGATSIMTEVPEMFGAEKVLLDRCITKEVFAKAVNMINGFKNYFISHNQKIYQNPSPGNIDGGITTLEEKSLGCVQKAGSAPVVNILGIGETPDRSGLHLLDGPGNDPVSVSILTASHVHLILFTTGRGTPLGGPVPTIKISSNTPLFEKKPSWIDFNAGDLFHGNTIQKNAEQLFSLAVKVASGEKYTANEVNGYREFHIFKTGITL